MSYYIIKQNKSGQNNRCCIDRAGVNLQVELQIEYTIIVGLDGALFLKLLLSFIAFEPRYTYNFSSYIAKE